MPVPLQTALLELFGSAFGDPAPGEVCFAPGRVNLIGAHVDYNEGPVVPIALDRGTLAAARPGQDGRIRLVSRDRPERIEFDLEASADAPLEGWSAYPIGLCRAFRRAGHALGGFDLAVAGDLDIGAGLSSSASLLVACARALRAAFGLELSDEQLALLAFAAETEHVGVSCGIMDPMASALARPGHALYLDCRDRSYEHLPFPREQVSVILVDSRTRRDLASSRFNERVAECAEAVAELSRVRPEIRALRDVHIADLERSGAALRPEVERRARHVVEEIGRVHRFREALAAGDHVTCGALVSASHASLRDLYETSTSALDFLVKEICNVPGALGARLTGAGWGGCVVALLERGAEQRVQDAVAPRYLQVFGQQARFHLPRQETTS